MVALGQSLASEYSCRKYTVFFADNYLPVPQQIETMQSNQRNVRIMAILLNTQDALCMAHLVPAMLFFSRLLTLPQ